MSQEKVDKYKEAKKNRKQIAKKEKREKILAILGGCFLVVLLGGYLIWSTVDSLVEEETTTETGYTLSEEQLSSLLEQLNSQTTAGGETTSNGETTKAGETTANSATTAEGDTAASQETTVAE